jgi:hypothetical protein
MTAHPDPHADESMVGAHGSTDDHGGTHGHDDHAHASEKLGPLDPAAWGAALLGIVLGVGIVVALVVASG